MWPTGLSRRTRATSSRARALPGLSLPSFDRVAIPFARALRGRHLLVIDLVGVVLAAYLALALRFDRITGPARIQDFPLILCLLLAVRTTTNIGLGLYSRRWRFASVPDLERIVVAVVQGRW